MSFRLIEAERAQLPVSLLCSVVGVTRGGYYAWRSRGRSARELRDGELAGLIDRIFDHLGGTYGAPRIQAELADDYGVRIGRKRVARLMKALGIEGVSRPDHGRRDQARADERRPAGGAGLVDAREGLSARLGELLRALLAASHRGG